MASLNVEKILTGTPEKAFLAARSKLADEYNETTASEFYSTYCDQPLSFILKHSREIFSETYFGYQSYLNIIDHFIYDPRVYAHEAIKVQKYVDEAREKRLPESQIEKYELLLEKIVSYSSATSNTAKCFAIAASSDGGEEFFENIFDALFDAERNSYTLLADDNKVLLDNVAEAIFSIDNVYCKMLAGFELCVRHRGYYSFLLEASRSLMGDYGKQDSLGDLQRFVDCVTTMLQDDYTMERLKTIKPLAEYWANVISNPNIATETACKILKDNQNEISRSMQVENYIPSDMDAVYMLGYVGTQDSHVEQDIACAKYDNLNRLRSIYEAKAERASVDGGIIAENAEDILCGIEAEIDYMEWEDDGSPNAVIQNHILTSKERAELQAQKDREKNTLAKALSDHNSEKENQLDNETTLCNQITEEIKKVGNIDGFSQSGEDDAKIKEVLKSSRSQLEKFRKIAKEKDYSRAIDLCNDLDDEIKVNDPMCESYGNETDMRLAMFLEDDNGDAGDPKKKDKPKKPKTDLATKIQNKALDRAAKDEQRLAKGKETSQKLKNAANAVSSTPKRVSDDLQKFVADFDKWDDNRRKEFLLKPGYRHKIIKHFKNALILGSVANINLACVPFFALVNHCSKLKDKRIRNELARELENEIHICEEKINDANSQGDNKSKYELMRIKDKLEAEKIRVRVNSNYM